MPFSLRNSFVVSQGIYIVYLKNIDKGKNILKKYIILYEKDIFWDKGRKVYKKS